MKITRLTVGALGTNCYIVASDKGGAFIIDPGDDLQEIKDFLARHNLKARFIINTHGHIDHIRANAGLGLAVYVHEHDAGMISDPKKNLSAAFLGFFEPVQPGRLLKDGDSIVLDELKFQVMHTPGHTRGSLCLLGGAVLFSGDTLFKDGVGRTDLPDSSEVLMRQSLKRLSVLDKNIIVYPGHGHQTTIGEEFGGGEF